MLDACSATNTMKFDICNDTEKHLLWKQYVAWHSTSYTALPICDYINNPVFQERMMESDYFGTKSDKRRSRRRRQRVKRFNYA